MQSQYYNQEKKYRSSSEIIQNVPGAEKLHFLVSAAVVGYLKQLDGIVPDGTLSISGSTSMKISILLVIYL